MSGAPPTRQNIQPQISRGIPPRENGCPGLTPGQPIITCKKGLNSEVKSNTNRVRQQDVVLDCPRHGSPVALPRAIRGRTRGACLCAAGNSKNWKKLLREARAAKKARKAALEEALAA
jgi:hypothetical protein